MIEDWKELEGVRNIVNGSLKYIKSNSLFEFTLLGLCFENSRFVSFTN